MCEQTSHNTIFEVYISLESKSLISDSKIENDPFYSNKKAWRDTYVDKLEKKFRHINKHFRQKKI